MPLPQPAAIKHQALQSYLYFRQPIKQQTPEPTKEEDTNESRTTEAQQPVAEQIITQAASQLEQTKPVAAKPQTTEQVKQKAKDIAPKNAPTNSFSAQQALATFSKRYQQQQLSNELKKYTQKRGFSVMDMQPEAVPEFTPELDWQEKERKATTNYGFNNIVKGEDGNCRLDQDLSFARNQGSKVSQYFDCGRTKQQKLYDAHMNKVLEKLGKNNKLLNR